MKWYKAWSGVRRAMGGITPRSIAGQEDDVFGVPAALAGHRVLDVIERIGGAGVLGELVVVQVD
jgi:hypothetical protein